MDKIQAWHKLKKGLIEEIAKQNIKKVWRHIVSIPFQEL